jgi:hypothetical protein
MRGPESDVPHNERTQETRMNVTRVVMLALAMLLPTTWTLAQAGDEMGEGDKSGEKKSSKKKSKKKEGGDTGGEKKEEAPK